MLKKLFIHEWKTASKMLLLFHGIMLIIALSSKVFFQLSGGYGAMDSQNELVFIPAMLFMLGIIFSVIIVGVFTHIYIGYRFYRHVFTDQGYLTNTLPVTPNQILLSKGLVGILWSILDYAIIILAIVIVVSNERIFSDIALLWKEISKEGIQAIFVMIYLFVTMIAGIWKLYFCVAVGNLFKSHKILGTVGVYMGLYIVEQIVSIAAVGIMGFHLQRKNMAGGLLWGISSASPATTWPIIASIAIVMIQLAIFWIVTRYIMSKKLNLQ